MQPVSQAINILSYVHNAPRGRVTQMARALVDSGLLPKSSGRAILQMAGGDLLYLIAAVAFAETVSDAATVARQVAELPMGGEVGAMTFRDAFGCMMKPDATLADVEIGLVQNGYTAKMVFNVPKDGEKVELTASFWTAKSWGGWTKKSFVLSREGVEIMSNLFNRDDNVGMVYKAKAD